MGLFGKSMREKEEEYMRRINVSECLKQDFRMRIDDTFTLIGTGTVVVGQIASGMCREGEPVFIVQQSGVLEAVITQIDIHTKARRPNHAAYAPEHVGIALRGIKKEQLNIGDVLIIRNGNKYSV